MIELNHKSIVTCLLMVALLWVLPLSAQEKQYKVGAIGFYNFENLFDTLDSPDTWDEEFTPGGGKGYTGKIYWEKQGNLAKVVSQLGTNLTPDGVALLGVAEIENRSVLEDFVKQDAVASRNYQIVHYESPDERGVDVALLYQPKYFTVTHSENIYVQLPLRENGDTNYTRDILWVSGLFDGEPMHVFVNHWPSRWGGEAASSPLREAAATTCKKVIDSLNKAEPGAKIIVMGDLNDDPVNVSVKDILGAKGKVKEVKGDCMYNPWYKFYKQGYGTLAWNDAWNLFDQIIISSSLMKESSSEYYFRKAEVFRKDFLLQQTGRFKGYPFRTYVANEYRGGYSDHLPVCIYLVKEVSP